MVCACAVSLQQKGAPVPLVASGLVCGHLLIVEFFPPKPDHYALGLDLKHSGEGGTAQGADCLLGLRESLAG